MSDLHLVVQLDAVADERVLDGAAVDRRVGADLDIVAEADAAEMGNLHVAVGVGREAEAVTADDGTCLENATRADRDVTADRDTRLQPAVVAEAAPSSITQFGPMEQRSPITTPAPTTAFGPIQADAATVPSPRPPRREPGLR